MLKIYLPYCGIIIFITDLTDSAVMETNDSCQTTQHWASVTFKTIRFVSNKQNKKIKIAVLYIMLLFQDKIITNLIDRQLCLLRLVDRFVTSKKMHHFSYKVI